MKKLLVVFLLLALPLHFSWAIAASYCQHEGDQTAPHFGHHSHQHQASGDSHDEGGKPSFELDADCGICHLSCAAAAVSLQPVAIVAARSFWIADPTDMLPSTVSEGPERPNWFPVA